MILTALCLCLSLNFFFYQYASAYDSTTLYNGCRGEAVREIQQALIDLGFLKGTADGIFGKNTENAVRKFQKKYKLTADGLAGTKTQSLIMSKVSSKAASSSCQSSSGKTDTSAASSSSSAGNNSSSSGSWFGGNYTSIRLGGKGDRVRLLQQALISLGYLKGNADGVFGKKTFAAVVSFQSGWKLSSDGVAGKKTLTAIESALSGASTPSASASSSSSSAAQSASSSSSVSSSDGSSDINDPIAVPSASSLQLLHWFNDVKPSVSNGQRLLIYDPYSGLNWTLRILSRGRHCDAEPLTAKDTRTMLKAFGGINTWTQKAVYVKLPDGRWTIGSTHDMPHQSGSVKNNDFNGHLCVHFLRDMAEAQQNDPSYGVSNQQTIRTYWKKWTGGEIAD